MSITQWSLACFLALTAGLALTQDSLSQHELNNCEVEVRRDTEPVAQVYAAEKPAGAEFTISTPISTTELSDYSRSKDGGGNVIAVTALAFKQNKATFALDMATKMYTLTIANGTDTKTFSETTTAGTYYPHGPFSYGYKEVRGPDGDIGDPEKPRTVLVWFENRGLKSGFTLTDI